MKKIFILLWLFIVVSSSFGATSTYIKGPQLSTSNQTIVASGGTTTLTVASPMGILVTGTSSHSIKLPSVGTLFEGFKYHVLNKSTQNISVVDSSSALLATIYPNTDKSFELYSSGVWGISIGGNSGKSLVGTSPIVITQDATSATFSLGTFNLDDLTDVNTSGVIADQVLSFNGTSWVVKDAGGASFAGAVTVPSITDNGGGSVTVGAVDVVLFSNATQVGTARKYSLPALTVTLIDNATNYIIADYAGGSPALANTTNINLINESSVVPIYTIYRSGSFLHVQSWDSLGNGLANKLHQSIVKTQRYRRESGLALGETGTRNVTLGSGIVWTGANSLSLGAISTGTDNLFYFLRTGASTWTTQVVTQYNNTDYWNGTTTASLTNNRYAVNWVYRGVESQKHLYVVLGEGDYTLTQAQASQPPANLPPQITSHALLVGRIIVLKSAATATQIDSSFNVVFSGAGASDHNSLTSLQGGTTGEYYHLTAAEDTAVASLSGTTTNYVLKRSSTGFVNSILFDDGTFVGIGNAAPTTKLDVTGDITTSGYVYFGNSTTNGSFRMTVSGGALVVQKRISGVWTQVASFDEN